MIACIKAYISAFISAHEGVQLVPTLNRLFSLYKARVLAALGILNDESETRSAFSNIPEQDSIRFAWLGIAGVKKRESGIFKYITTLYSLFGTNDATQATTTSQPYETGFIAPNENEGLQNPNGDARYMTHPEISFAADEAWSVTTVLNNLFTDVGATGQGYCGENSGLASSIFLQYSGQPKFVFYNSLGTRTTSGGYGLSEIVGKNSVLTVIADGLGSVYFYINGDLKQTSSIATSFVFSELLVGVAIDDFYFNGSISAHIIRSQALTATQVAAEAAYLQTLYPGIPTVPIGIYNVASSNANVTSTCEGNVIANVTDNAVWASSQTIYNTTVGTVYEKTKAAAMWCYYDNDSEIGSWAGKLYNWFAIALIQADIDTYNAANPTAHWGYHVPSSAEFTNLQTILGGSAVAGGYMKKDGLDYWLTPNTGATNSSGFTTLGGSYRGSGGAFIPLNVYFTQHCVEGLKFIATYSTNTTMTINTSNKTYGHSLRFISDTLNDVEYAVSYTAVEITQTGTIAEGNVQYQTAAEVIAALPTEIAVTLNDASVVNIPVTWEDTDTYDPTTAADYTFTGTWGTIPEGVSNGEWFVPPTTELTVAQGTHEILTDSTGDRVTDSTGDYILTKI